MRTTTLTFPELFLIAATRGLLGAGLALLFAKRLTDSQRETAGVILTLIGALTTIPLAIEAFGKKRKLMKSKLLHKAPERIFALVFDEGDDVTADLLAFARTENLRASQFNGIGAFSGVVLGYFDLERRDYKRIPIVEQVEVLSLTGNVALKDTEHRIHAHVVLGKRDGTAHGGHLLEAHVRPTLELIVTESPAYLHRETDEKTGLALIEL